MLDAQNLPVGHLTHDQPPIGPSGGTVHAACRCCADARRAIKALKLAKEQQKARGCVECGESTPQHWMKFCRSCYRYKKG